MILQNYTELELSMTECKVWLGEERVEELTKLKCIETVSMFARIER